ncbi:MAG: DNA polymerase III subunit gamma/tau [Anaerolineae bacterium]|nr:DNA polymerase III subunit gamma/tau [Anaerolineae bacterium]
MPNEPMSQMFGRRTEEGLAHWLIGSLENCVPQALYLKYRPRTFDEIEGQEHIRTTLKNAIALGRIAHAYLFTGPRGTGKTTTARVLAKAVNCLSNHADKPCNACAVCQAINEDRMLDLIEIDAASNTSVEDVRDLRDKVDFRPGEARYKVYVIDEVHMLSNAAFNALLKTLEEPPPHVIFILATTDPQKIPATVLSRVQRFDFRRLTLPEIVARLSDIARKENLKVEPAALELIARHATGAMRDAISLLDQLMSYGSDEITLAQVQGLLGAASSHIVSELVAHLAARHNAQGLALIAQAVDNGADPRQLARDIVEYLRGVLLVQSGCSDALTLTAEALDEMRQRAAQISAHQLVRAIRLFNQAAFELRASAHPTLPLEIAWIEALMEETPAPMPAPSNATPAMSASKPPAPVAPSSRTSPPPPAPSPARASAPPPPPDPAAMPSAVAGDLTLPVVQSQWTNILARVKQSNRNAEALLRSAAEPIGVEGDVIVLGFQYQVHAEKFEKEKKWKETVERALGQIFQRPCRVKCVLTPERAKRKAVEQDPLIQAAMSQGGQITGIHEG